MEYVAQRNFLRRGYQSDEDSILADRRAHPADYKHARIYNGRSTTLAFLTWDGSSSEAWQRFVKLPLTEFHPQLNKTKGEFRYQRSGIAGTMAMEANLRKKAWMRAVDVAIETSVEKMVFDEEGESSEDNEDDETKMQIARVEDVDAGLAVIASEDTHAAKSSSDTWIPTLAELMDGAHSDNDENENDDNDEETIYSIIDNAEYLENILKMKNQADESSASGAIRPHPPTLVTKLQMVSEDNKEDLTGNDSIISNAGSEAANVDNSMKYQSFNWADDVIDAADDDAETLGQEANQQVKISIQYSEPLAMTAAEEKLFYDLEKVLEAMNYDLVTRGLYRRLGDWATFLQYNPMTQEVEWAHLEKNKSQLHLPKHASAFQLGDGFNAALSQDDVRSRCADAVNRATPYLLVTDTDTDTNFDGIENIELLLHDHNRAYKQHKRDRDAAQARQEWEAQRWRAKGGPQQEGQGEVESAACEAARAWWRREQFKRDTNWMMVYGEDPHAERIARKKAYAEERRRRRRGPGKHKSRALEGEIERLSEHWEINESEIQRQEERVRLEKEAAVKEEEDGRVGRPCERVRNIIELAQTLLPDTTQDEKRAMEETAEAARAKAMEERVTIKMQIEKREKMIAASLFLQMAESGLDRNTAKEMEMAKASKPKSIEGRRTIVTQPKHKSPLSKSKPKSKKTRVFSSKDATGTAPMIFTSPHHEVSFHTSRDFFSSIEADVWERSRARMAEEKAWQAYEANEIMKSDVELQPRWWEMEGRMTARVESQRDGVKVLEWM